VPVSDLCREHGMSSASFCKWRSKYGGMDVAEWAVHYRSASIALACRAFSICETCYRYQPKLSDENEFIADGLVALTNAKKTWGFGLCFVHLRNVKGFGWNHKRVYASIVSWS